MKTVEIKNDELATAWTEFILSWQDLRDACDAEAIDRIRSEPKGEVVR